jgi:hypothetical protein
MNIGDWFSAPGRQSHASLLKVTKIGGRPQSKTYYYDPADRKIYYTKYVVFVNSDGTHVFIEKNEYSHTSTLASNFVYDPPDSPFHKFITLLFSGSDIEFTETTHK